MKKVTSGLVLLTMICCFANIRVLADMGSDKTSYTNKEVDLRISLRKLFSDNLSWQRIYFLEALSVSAEADKAKDRLGKNAENLANALKPYIGDEAGNQLTQALKQNIQLISDYVNAARTGADKSFTTEKMHDNLDNEADILSRANMSWPKSDLSAMLKKYNDSLFSEIDSQNSKMGQIDQALFDSTTDQALSLADYFSFGLMQGYPGKFW